MAVKQLQNTNYLNLNMGSLVINNTNDATSTSTGVLNVMGGAGLAKNLYVGGTINGNIIGIPTDTDVDFQLDAGGNLVGIHVYAHFTKVGKSVIVTIQSFSGTAESKGYPFSGAIIPSTCIPSYGITFPCLISINNVATTCYITFQTNRKIVWHYSLASFDFQLEDVIETFTFSGTYETS